MSKIDIEKIDAQIRKLEKLKEFLADPTTAPIIEQFISSNGNGAAKLAKNRQKIGDFKGHLLSAVAKACGDISPDVEFTVHDVMERMSANGYEHLAKNPQVAVNTSLARLVKKHKILRSKEAHGQTPAKYKHLQRFPRTGEDKSEIKMKLES